MPTSINPERVRLDQCTLKTESDVNDALYQYGVLDTKIKIWKNRAKVILDALKRIIQTKVDRLAGQKNLMRMQIEQYLRMNKADFEKPRSKTLTFGKIGWRKSPGKLDLNDEAEATLMDTIERSGVVEAYDAMEITITGSYNQLKGLVFALRRNDQGELIERKLHKDELKKLPEAVMQKLGIELDGDDVPFFLPDSKTVLENSGISSEVDPMATPNFADLATQLTQLQEEA